MKELQNLLEVVFWEDEEGIRIFRLLDTDARRDSYFGCSYEGLLHVTEMSQKIKVGESSLLTSKIGQTTIIRIDVDVIGLEGWIYEDDVLIRRETFLIHTSTLNQIKELIFFPPTEYISGSRVYLSGSFWKML